MRILDGYKISQVSTGKVADLVQAWSTPLTAQGDTASLDSKAKSEFDSTASQAGLMLGWLICVDDDGGHVSTSIPGKLLVQPVEQKQTTHIVTGQILDWSFTYGAEPSIFIATELAW